MLLPGLFTLASISNVLSSVCCVWQADITTFPLACSISSISMFVCRLGYTQLFVLVGTWRTKISSIVTPLREALAAGLFTRCLYFSPLCVVEGTSGPDLSFFLSLVIPFCLIDIGRVCHSQLVHSEIAYCTSILLMVADCYPNVQCVAPALTPNNPLS